MGVIALIEAAAASLSLIVVRMKRMLLVPVVADEDAAEDVGGCDHRADDTLDVGLLL